jgi:hypothetical protein
VESEEEVTQLNDVSVGENAIANALAVDENAVLASIVGNADGTAFDEKARVATRDRLALEYDVVLRGPSDRRLRAIELDQAPALGSREELERRNRGTSKDGV